jgi:putative transposase
MKLTLHLSHGYIIWVMEFIKLSQSVYHCEYHILMVTKYRRAIFNEGIFTYYKKKLVEITEHYPLVQIIEANHDKDHVHVLISIPPTMSVGEVVGLIKQNTSRALKKKFPTMKQIYWGTDAIWSEGYFVSTVGIAEGTMKAYIEEQGKKDAGQTKFETV